jgi:hypothetical protein
MNELIRQHGGDGIVVSLAECVERYPHIRELLSGTGCALPADFRELREWSLVMAMTGLLNAIDRGLIGAALDAVVHGSGSYSVADYQPLTDVIEVRTVADIARALC